MRLELSRKTDLAVRLLRLLAAAGERRNGADLAAALGTTTNFLPQVVAPLVRSGWVVSTSGPRGGYELIVAPERLSLGQVIEALEGPLIDGRCLLRPKACPGGEPCILHAPWERARAALLDELRSTPVYTPAIDLAVDGDAGNNTAPLGDGRETIT